VTRKSAAVINDTDVDVGTHNGDVVLQNASVQEWLDSLHLPQYLKTFMDSGYDNINFIVSLHCPRYCKGIVTLY
jgi:hypothetical protein